MADKKNQEPIFWADTKSTFGSGVKFGDEVKDLDDVRREKWLESGRVKLKRPESVEHVKEDDMNKLRQLLAVKDEIIEGLDHELKGMPKTTKEAQKKVTVANEKLREAMDKIEDLEKQVEELTKPDGKGGK